MEKLIYALWRETDQDPADVAAALLATASPAIAVLPGVRGLTLYAEEPAADAMRWGTDPRGLVLAGLATIWVDRVEQRSPIEELLALVGTTIGGYVVAESTPIDYIDRTWPDGERSPGISLVTLFSRVAGMADDELYAIWHGSHTPLTFEIHPFWLYLRNAVARVLTPGAPAFDAIVQEAVPTDEDLLDLGRLYGAPDDPEARDANIARISGDARRFIDFATLQTAPMREVIVRSAPWQHPGGG
jgi:hypothetical protein